MPFRGIIFKVDLYHEQAIYCFHNPFPFHLSPVTERNAAAVKPAKIAVVLGAGAAKGFAHVGVLKVLESNKIPVHMVVGTSAGSFVGALYAYGFSAFELQKISFSIERDDIIDLTIPDNGFIKGEKLEGYINSIVKNTPIEKLKIPFYAVAADLQTERKSYSEAAIQARQ